VRADIPALDKPPSIFPCLFPVLILLLSPLFAARAMLMRADILLLDEPTNHLDVANVAWLENYLVSRPEISSVGAMLGGRAGGGLGCPKALRSLRAAWVRRQSSSSRLWPFWEMCTDIV